MNPPNKNASGMSAIPQPLSRPAGHAPHFNRDVTQLKTSVSAQSVKRPIAPPVYRPQAVPKVMQLKMTTSVANSKPPVAPPVYRPHPVPKVLQTKSSLAQNPHAGLTKRQPVASPVHRPEVKKVVQPKDISQRQKQAIAPISRALSGVAQRMPGSPRPTQSRTPITATVPFHRSRETGAVIQRAESATPRFEEVLGTRGLHEQKPALVVTFSNEGKEQTRRYGEIVDHYKHLRCKVLKETATWDYDAGKMSELSKKDLAHLQRSLHEKDGVLVVTGHGNLQWLFGAVPGSEAEAMKGFVNWIHEFEKSSECTLRTVVLDSCFSAAELKEPAEGVSSDSSARILSRLLGDAYRVIGFNGKAATGFVSHQGGKDDYGANAVVFVGGRVIKGSIHKDVGQGITHSTQHINTEHEFYARSFPRGKPELYRSNSFSKASPTKPQ